MTAHSVISPSSAHRWMACPGSVALCADIPRTSSKYADEGTQAHELAAALLKGDDALPQIGDLDMVAAVETYVEAVRAAAQGGVLYVEQQVDLSDVLGPEMFGTADAIVLQGDELQAHDLKTGRGVRVDAVQNEQLMLYALGALKEYELIGDYKTVRLFIHQPRLDHVDEWAISVDELKAWGEETQTRAAHALEQLRVPYADQLELTPGEKQCRFCSAKATCPALSAFVQGTTALEFDNLDAPTDHLTQPEEKSGEVMGQHMAAVGLVEAWCTAVREEAFRRLAAGEDVPGYKLVEGRRGARAWSSKEEAEAALKAMRLKVEDMYDLSLISPTSAEKLSKAGTIGPRQWPKLQGLITQPPGRPSVAPASDKRPAISVAAAPTDFEDLTA